MDHSGGSNAHDADAQGLECPRVVIFEGDGGPRVEVVELTEDAGPGALFCHSGTRWQVTATRTGNRVLIARPFQARFPEGAGDPAELARGRASTGHRRS